MKNEIHHNINYKNKLIEHNKKDICDDFENFDKTFQIIKIHLDFFKISRIANLSGLDRIGIPIVNIIRPNLNEYNDERRCIFYTLQRKIKKHI